MAAHIVTDEAEFLAALPVIDDAAGQVCRRFRLGAAEADDFRSEARMHFLERNYEVLRRFEGRASLATYITVVVQHLFLDRRNRQWGRWRPSVAARRLGPTGVLLERMVVRDGVNAEQALDLLRAHHGVVIDDPIRAFADGLSRRGPVRRFVPDEEAGDVASEGPSADATVLRAEQDFLVKRVRSVLERTRRTLAPLERLVLKMRFEDHIAVADIARALHLDQRRLYRTIERLLGVLRDQLAAEGIAQSDVDALMADREIDWAPEPDRDSRPAAPPADQGAPWQRGR